MSDEVRYSRRNMVLGVFNGIFFNLAAAFLHSGTVIPLFISTLSSSKVIIGLFSTLETFGWYWPQLFSGAILAGYPLVLWFYNRMSIIRAIAFAAILCTILIANSHHQSLLLWGFGIFFGIYCFAGGLAGVPFMEVVGKTIPANKRGTLFGLRMFWGGILAVVAGPLVKKIIDTYEFPADFGILFTIAFVFISLGLATFAFAEEHPSIIAASATSLRGNLRQALILFSKDRNLRRLVAARILSFFYFMAMPFYVIVATEQLKMSKALAATYLSFEMTGYLGLNFLWAWLSDHISNKQVMKLATLCALASPVIAVFSMIKNPGYFIFGLAFFFNGATASGTGLGFLNYLLEIAPANNRALAVGLVHTLVAPAALLSVAGGLVIELVGLIPLFVITFGCQLLSFLYICHLAEPLRGPRNHPK